MNRITTRITLLLLGYASLLLNSLLLGADDFTPTNTQAAGEHPLPPAEAAGRLSVPEGFQVTLAAAEPDVRQPIAIAFDDRGRLWVAESYSYNGSKFTDEPHDRILIFEDTTGDGVLDRRTVFREGLTRLTGLQLGFGGVWITRRLRRCLSFQTAITTTRPTANRSRIWTVGRSTPNTTA